MTFYRHASRPHCCRGSTGYNGLMFATFFHELKSAKLPVTLKEYLTLLEAVEAGVAGQKVEDFYYLVARRRW